MEAPHGKACFDATRPPVKTDQKSRIRVYTQWRLRTLPMQSLSLAEPGDMSEMKKFFAALLGVSYLAPKLRGNDLR